MAPALIPFCYRYTHPLYPHALTLDCTAATREAALHSATRFLSRENRRLRALGERPGSKGQFGRFYRVRLPRHVGEMVNRAALALAASDGRGVEAPAEEGARS